MKHSVTREAVAITLEVSLEELQFLLGAIGRSNYSDIRESLRSFNKIELPEVDWRKSEPLHELYTSLVDAVEEARA